MLRSHAPDLLSRSPFEQSVFGLRPPPSTSDPSNGAPGSFLRSPEQLPRIAEKVEHLPLFANSFDPDLQARLLSEQIAAHESSNAPSSKPHGGSYERSTHTSDADASTVTMKKAQSYQALADLEKKGYFPAAPKVQARSVSFKSLRL